MIRINILQICLLLICVSVISTISSTSDVEIICTKFDEYNFMQVGRVRECSSTREPIVSTNRRSEVKAIVHENLTLSHDELIGIESLYIIAAMKLQVIPNGLGEMLPNLKVLLIVYSGLLAVDRRDFRQFGGSLEVVGLNGNKLTTLDGNLFECNKNLKSIDFYGNSQLVFIDPEFFENLKNMKKLTLVGFNDCGCIDQNFYVHEGHDIDNFVWRSDVCNEYDIIQDNSEWIRSDELNQTCVIEAVKDSATSIMPLLGKVLFFCLIILISV